MKKIGGPFFVFFFFFSVYLVSLAPSVFWWDSGELIANVKTLGIPHRPGFPLYVLLAKVFSLLPIGSFVFTQNLFSAFCGALALVFFHFSLVLFLGRLKALLGGSAARRNLTAFFVTLAVGFTFTFWIQAVRAEVYTLGALLFTFVLYCFLKATPEPQLPTTASPSALFPQEGPQKAGTNPSPVFAGGEGSEGHHPTLTIGDGHTARWFWLGVFIFFLGLGNHHITLLSTFPFLAAVVGLPTFAGLGFKKWLGLFFLFAIGISVYLYLPVRSQLGPFFNWGGASDFNSTANLVFATDSYPFISRSPALLGLKMFQLLSLLFDQLGPGLFGLSFGGLLILLFAQRSWFVKIVLLVLGNLFVAAVLAQEVYADNPDLHGYLVYALFGLGFALAASIAAFFGVVERAVGTVSNFLVGFSRASLALLFLFVALVPWSFSRTVCDLSDNRIALKMAQEALAPVPPGGVVVLDSPNLDFVLRGVQYGELWRQDVTVVNRAFLEADWYRQNLARNFPRLAAVFASTLKGATPDSLFHLWTFRLLERGVPVFIEFTERDKNLVNRLSPAGYLFEFKSGLADTMDAGALEKQVNWELSNLWSEDDRGMQNDPQAIKMLVLYLYRSGLYYEWRGIKKKALNFYRKTVAWGEKSPELQKRIFRLEKEISLAERNTPAPLSLATPEPKRPVRRLSR